MSTGRSTAGRRTARRTEISTFKGQERALRAGRIGTAALLLSITAASAPLMVTAGIMPTTYSVMGIVGQPLLFLILGCVLALFSVGYAEMSRHVHNAGAFYAYIARGLGGTAGVASSVVALVAYSAMQVAIYGIFGFEISGLLETHCHLTVAWWLPAVLGVLVIGCFGALKIDLNARVLGVLLLVEIALVLTFDLASVASPGDEGLSLHAFNPHTIGGAGLGTALCFCVAAFIGFEHAPVYAEETSRPHVVVARVTFLCVGFVAVFLALGSWAMGVAVGPSHVVTASAAHGPDTLFSLSEGQFGGTYSNVLHVFYVTGMFVSLLSFHNVVARYAFAMGREGLLPAALGRTTKSTGAPAVGSLLQTGVSLLVVAAFAATDGNPHGDPTAPVLHLFTWMANVGALGVISLMAATSAAVIVFFARRGSARAQAWRLLSSAVAGIALLTIVLYAAKDFHVLVDTGAHSALRWALPGVMGLTVLLGLGYGLLVRTTRPALHARIGLGNEAFQLEKAATRDTDSSPRRSSQP